MVVITGTARGSDTAPVMQAASTKHLKRLRVHEIICKPLHPLNIGEVLEEYSSGRLEDYSIDKAGCFVGRFVGCPLKDNNLSGGYHGGNFLESEDLFI